MAGSVLQNPFAKPAPQQTVVTQQPQNKDQLQSTVIPPEDNIDAGDPNKKVDPNKKGAGDDPMMDFSKLWEDEPVDPNKQIEPKETGFLPKIDPAKIAETLGKIDFSKSMTPEEATAITGGGEKATQAHLSVLNKSLRQSMMTMFNVAHKMVEQGLTNAEGRFLERVPSHVKNIMVESDLTATDPLMSNPAFSPMVEAARQRFQEKFPKATPVQITKAVSAYLKDMVKAATKPEVTIEEDNAKKLTKGAADADWDKWIEAEISKGSL